METYKWSKKAIYPEYKGTHQKAEEKNGSDVIRLKMSTLYALSKYKMKTN